MTMAMRVAGEQQNEGNCGINGDKEGDGNSNEGKGDKGGGQGTVTRAMATIWAMGTAMRLVSDIEKKGKGSKSNGEGDFGVAGEEEDGRQVD